MPPSRGLRPIGNALSRIGRSPIASNHGARMLSSSALTARHGAKARIVAPSSSLPVTGYILHSGRANLSLWPFSSDKPTIPPPNDAKIETWTIPLQDPAASSQADTVNSAASQTADTASTLASQASSSIQDAAHEVATTVEHAIEPSTVDLPPPTTLFDNITQIGQLRELGLDYGWGPTASVEWITEHIHVFAGTPWWGTIITSAIAMRLLMVYPFFRMSKEQAKFTAIGPELKKLTDERQRADAAKEPMAMQIATKKMSILKNRAGISMTWMFAPLAAQMIFGFGAFKLTRAMAALPVPGFETGGFAWMTDLTVCDPTYITPLAMVLAMHLLGRWSVQTPTGGDNGMQQMAKPLSLYVFPAMMFGVTFWQCAALQLSFLAATIFGMVQNLIFRNARFREVMSMGPLTPPTTPTQSILPTTSAPGQPRIVARPNPSNPYANLNLARGIKGSAVEKGAKYQAPTAAFTLKGPQSLPEDPVVPKEGSFIARELKSAKDGVLGVVDGSKKFLSKIANTNQPANDHGRDSRSVRLSRQQEERRRKEGR